ncbi:MAG: rRNA maturation RNase YbeY [Nannocystis sp.]|nr:rRNA maturation RNase YbeY [Nannocystis sp.]
MSGALAVSVGLAVDPAIVRELRRRLRRAGRRLGLSPRELEGVALHIVDDLAIARLNREHMGKRGPTDVLSFPTGERDDGDPDGPPIFLGDIILSWPAVRRQARYAGPRGRLDEATVLTIHGLCHLLGHDHRERREGRVMHREERRALAAARVADIPRPYGRTPT